MAGRGSIMFDMAGGRWIRDRDKEGMTEHKDRRQRMVHFL